MCVDMTFMCSDIVIIFLDVVEKRVQNIKQKFMY